MRKLLKSKKALSPVVAAIILIAVTVAVSIAVAAWMGSLTMGFTETEQLNIVSLSFDTTNNDITVSYQNTGTSDIILTSATVTGGLVNGTTLDSSPVTCTKGSTSTFTVSVTLSSGNLVEGTAYNVEVLSSKGNKFQYTDTA
jgi:flagellin-like protein